MKRSEAVEEIRKILAMNGKDNGYGELEEAILHHLESLGMLPPSVMICDLIKAGTVDDATNYRTVNIWELEDEEK